MKKTLLKRFLITIVSILLVFFVSFTVCIQIITSTYIERHVKDNIYTKHDRVQESFANLIYDMLTHYYQIFTDENISNLVKSSRKQEDLTLIYTSANLNEDVYSGISLFLGDDIYTTDNNLYIPSKIDFQNYLNNDNWFQYINTVGIKNNKNIIFGIKLSSSLNKNDVIGLVAVYIKESIINEMVNTNSKIERTYILNNEHYVICDDSDSDISGSVLYFEENYQDKFPYFDIKRINGEKSLLVFSSMDKVDAPTYKFDFKILTIQNYDVVFASLERLTLILTIIGSVVLLGGIVLAVFLSKKIVSPIKKLSDKIEHFQVNGTTHIVLSSNEDDELQHLEKAYDEMIARIYSLMAKQDEDNETKRKLELDALQMQINPHFLYNTLDAIAWMAKIKNQIEIEHLVLALAKFFRISLHKGDKFITVEEEIEVTRHYLEIELFRFPDQFDVSYEIGEEVKKYQTLKLILQPLVENAIKHGLSTLDQKGLLTIKAYLDEDKNIIYEIIDNGRGFEVPQDILLKTPEKQLQKSGYGIINVNERIKLEYGEQYGLSIVSKVDEGTKIIIKIKGNL